MVNKTGSIQDIGLLLVVLLMLGVGLPIMVYTSTQVFSHVENNTVFNASSNAMEAYEDSNDKINNNLDLISVGVYFGFILALIITGFLVNTSSVFFIIYLIAAVILVIVGGIISYVWDNIAATSLYSTLLTTFPITNHLLSNSAVYVTIAIAASMLALYFKNRQGGTL